MSKQKKHWLWIILGGALTALASLPRARPPRALEADAAPAPSNVVMPAAPAQRATRERARHAPATAIDSASLRNVAGAPALSAIPEDPGSTLLDRALAATQTQPTLALEGQRDPGTPQSDPAGSPTSSSPPPMAAVLEAWTRSAEDPVATRETRTYLEQTARAVELDPNAVTETDCRGDVCRASLVFPTLAAAFEFQAASNPADDYTVYVSRKGADIEPDAMRFELLIQRATANPSDAAH